MHKPRPAREEERRAQVRYAHGRKASCRLLGRDDEEFWPATIEDVSRTGVAVAADVECRRGAVLVVKTEGLAGRFARPILVRVANVRGRAGRWVIGCTFVTPLAEEDIEALLLAVSGRR
jgi:hypothetical protein